LVCKLGKKIGDSKKILFENEKIGGDPQNWGEMVKTRIFGVQTPTIFFTSERTAKFDRIRIEQTLPRLSVYHTSLEARAFRRKKWLTDAFWGILAENGKVHTKTRTTVTFLKPYLQWPISVD
jgi:hypothetical protein